MANTHLSCPVLDTQGGWSLSRRSDAILTNVGGASGRIILMGYEHREDAFWGGGSRHWQTHKHTHSVSLVIHRVDGASAKNPTLY